jgi:hypothetical protein
MIATQHYMLALEQAKQDLSQKLREREKLSDEINRLKQSIRLLGELAKLDPAEIDKWLAVNFAPVTQLGLTDAVRRAFETGSSLTPVEVRDFVLNLGVGAEQVNLLASIHTILKRLIESGEIEKFGEADFSNSYRKRDKKK